MKVIHGNSSSNKLEAGEFGNDGGVGISSDDAGNVLLFDVLGSNQLLLAIDLIACKLVNRIGVSNAREVHARDDEDRKQPVHSDANCINRGVASNNVHLRIFVHSEYRVFAAELGRETHCMSISC